MGWNQDDLTAAASASLPGVNRSMSAYAFEDQGSQHVIYLGQDIHVEELDKYPWSFLVDRSIGNLPLRYSTDWGSLNPFTTR